MLFHTWPFAIFLLIVLPVYFALQKTRLWLPWLTAASYFFYGWWNPYYLLLVAYSTLLDYSLVAFMDHCPRAGPRKQKDGKLDDTPSLATEATENTECTNNPKITTEILPPSVPSVSSVAQSQHGSRSGDVRRFSARGLHDPLLKAACIGAVLAACAILAGAIWGPPTLRPTLLGAEVLMLLMALGALLGSRRIWLLVSIVNNLALLLFFKYAGFLVENLNALFAQLHLPWTLADPATLMPFGFDYLLPVGISFFTFQSLSYTIDFYFGNVERERSLLRFATFVCFFPQLMAGPIERARHLLPQFQKFPTVRLQNFTDGTSLFLVGLFKKLALANYLSLYVERVYEHPETASASALLIGTVAFGWQIYFDFSGYTDMARGVARLMGFNLMLNFNNPYLAASLGEFWSRWHISLSTWFRDYVYIPLGGNRLGTWLTYRNLLITFLISGIWHGSKWNFLIWGALHGLGVIATRELERSAFYREKIPRLLKQIAVFAFVSFTWIFFRAESLPDALLILRRIATAGWGASNIPLLMVALIASVWAYAFLYESRFRAFLKLAPIRVALAVAMVLYLCLCASGGGAFIYFQF